MSRKPATYRNLTRRFRSEADPAVAGHSRRFFKTGKGEYGQGDRFLGIRVPVTRSYARSYRHAPLPVVGKLLESEYHEERLLAVILLVDKFRSGSAPDRRTIYELYLENTAHINNWDIVDASAPHIVGAFLHDRGKEKLFELAASGDLWERRIAVMSTFHFIRQGDFETTLEISEKLLEDGEDLIHKAVGWMLREIGKRDAGVEEKFLKAHCRTMPRTMLRYAIEKFPPEKRRRYLSGEV